MDRHLQTILTHDNPWLNDPACLETWLQRRLPARYIPRQAYDLSTSRWGEMDRAHLLIGPRQAGKSTLSWAHLASRKAPALYLDCERTLVRDLCQSAPLFLDELGTLLDDRVTLFFDKVQHLVDTGLFLKGLLDRRIGAPLLVTASSSIHLAGRTRESLAGRATRTRLLPFSLAEVTRNLADRPRAIQQRKIGERMTRHLVYGGYPEVWTTTENAEFLLADLVESIILRDASDLFRIGRPDAFRHLMQLTAGQVGSLVNLSEWAAVLGISRDTVSSYVEILESSHVVSCIPPFAGGRRAEITSRRKIFFIDNGIRNQLVGSFAPIGDRPDAGATMENWVFSELWKTLPPTASLHFWRSSSGAEVDFVISQGNMLIGIEVKAGGLARPRLPRAARSFIDAYEPRAFLLVNSTLDQSETLGTTTLRWLTPASIASTVEDLLANP